LAPRVAAGQGSLDADAPSAVAAFERYNQALIEQDSSKLRDLIYVPFVVVDDSPRVRAVLRATLADLASDLAECYDGDQVLASYEAFRPDLVLMDVRMPGMDGIQATALLKKTHPTARVVIVSDHDQDDVRVAARQAGAEAYVVKTNLVVLRELLG